MSTYRRILVGTDGTPTAAIAERAAAQLAARLTSDLLILTVSDPDAAASETEERLAMAAARALAAGVMARTEARIGEPAATIMATAHDSMTDLIVVGDRGMGEAKRLTLGGIPDRVAHNSPVDILVVRTSQSDRDEIGVYRSVLIATDGSPTAAQAAGRGYALARALGAAVSLVYVGDDLIGDIVLRDAAARLKDESIARLVRRGRAAEEIIRLAGSRNHDLIVVGNKGMAGSRHVLRKVVPGQVAHNAGVDVLICKSVGRQLRDLRPGEGAVVEVGDQRVAAFIDDDGIVYALSARCQHLGCTVGWNGRARTWDCPCHGSRYDFRGGIINGPTQKPLPPVEIPAEPGSPPGR